MEGVSATVYRGIKRYLRRKDYERLNKRGMHDDGSTRRRRRFKLTRRLKLKLRFSPTKLLLGLRDAYVHMMIRVANNGGYGFGMGSHIKEYDERVIVEIHRSGAAPTNDLIALHVINI